MKKLFIYSALYFLPSLSYGFTIKGKIRYPSGHTYRVSIFHLRNLDEFHMLGDYNLVQYALTDSAGEFSLQADFVPDEETIYRVHIRKIEFEKDTLGDLIFSNAKSGKITSGNYFYIALNGSANISIDIVNQENIIFHHTTSMYTHPFEKLYTILRKYDKRISEIHNKISSSVKQMPRLSPEIDSLVKERTLSLKDSLFNQLSAFIKNTTNVNAAVTAYSFVERAFKPSLGKRISLFENIEAKGQKSKYLPPIAEGLEKEKEKARLAFLNRYSTVTSILSLLLLISVVVLLLKYRAIRKELQNLKESEKDIYSLLTRKEIEIFEMLAQGLSNKEIAAAQYLEISTIKKHITNIYAKTGIKSRNEAATLLKKSPKTV